VKYIDSIGKFRHVDDTERPSGVPNPDFLNPGANPWHGLPVIRLVALLHLVKLMTRFTPCRHREGSKIIERTTPEFDGFAIGHHLSLYNLLYIIASPNSQTVSFKGVYGSVEACTSLRPLDIDWGQNDTIKVIHI
jgi:hypothetical protein